MADDDYAPVAAPDDEEDPRKRLYNEMYPPVSAPPVDPTGAGVGVHDTANTSLSAAGYPAPQPTSAAPQASPAPANGAPMPAPDVSAPAADARPDYSDLGPPVTSKTQAPPPSWKDYAPAEKHGWGKFGSVMASLNPLSDRIVNQRPLANAERNYEAATNEFKEKEGQGKEASTEELQKAQTENQRAEADAHLHPPADWKNVPNLQGPHGEPIELNEKTGEHRYGTITGAKPIRQPGETQEQNKQAFQGVIAKLDAAGLTTDPKTIDKSLDAALKQGKITPQEHASARAYQSANPTPATNLTVHVAGQEEGDKLARSKLFEGSEVIAHMPDGRRVQMSYADAQAQGLPPERLVKLNAHEAQENRDKQASVQTSFQGLDRYRNNLKALAPKLSPEERDALRVLTAHTEKTAGALGGLLDDLPIAGPMTDYANRLMQGTITSDQYKQLKSPEAKKLVSDYFTSIIDNFASMKARLGSVGRNPAQLQAEINTIPLPYLDWESANGQFENKRSSLTGFAQSMPELYTPKK